MCVLFVVLSLLGSTFARFYILDDEEHYGALHRSKRQTHPSSTLARLPSDSFSPITDHIFAQLQGTINDGNVRNGRQLSRPNQNPGASFKKWELGYNAGDILTPPIFDNLQTEETRYRTINVYKPSRPEQPARDTDSSATVVWGTLKAGSKINHPFVDNPEQFRPISPEPNYQDYATQSNYRQANYAQPVRQNYNGQRQVHYDEDEEDSSEGSSDEDYNEAPPVRPVYTYVKTDKNGHYKWGVHHGALQG